MDPKDELPTQWPEFDPRQLLRRLIEAGVDFVVIGGIAVNLSGYGRMTRDLDIVFAPDSANVRALGGVLTGLNARLRGVEDNVTFVADERTLGGIQLLTLETDLGWLDIHREVPGMNGYSALRDRAERVTLDGVPVSIASIDDLLAMKRAAGRDLDGIDVSALEAIKRLRDR